MGWGPGEENERTRGRGRKRASLRVEENETAKKDGQKGKQGRLQSMQNKPLKDTGKA